MPTEFPDRSWQRVASDTCDMNGTPYLVAIDYIFRYLEVQRLSIIPVISSHCQGYPRLVRQSRLP